MFTKCLQISSVAGDYLHDNDDLYCWRNGAVTSIQLNTEETNWISKIDNTQQLFFSDKSSIYPYRQYHCIKKVSKNDGVLCSTFEGDIFPVSIVDDKIYAEYDNGEHVYISELNLLDFSNKALFVINQKRLLLSINCFFFLTTRRNTIECHSLTTGAELWKVDVGELGQWLDYDGKTMVIGVVKNVYPVGAAYVVTEVERSALACFEVETGKLVWRFNGPYTTHFLVAFYEDTFFVFSDSYYEIDALTGNVLRTENYIPIFNEAKVRPAMFSTPAISDKYIAISSHHDTAILLINRSTFTVEQRIALEGCKSGIPLSNAPRLYGNRLYQLDGDGTLHIFEEKE